MLFLVLSFVKIGARRDQYKQTFIKNHSYILLSLNMLSLLHFFLYYELGLVRFRLIIFRSTPSCWTATWVTKQITLQRIVKNKFNICHSISHNISHTQLHFSRKNVGALSPEEVKILNWLFAEYFGFINYNFC